MKSTKTAIMAMIVALAMIGTLGMAGAVTTDVTYRGDGSYTADFDGEGSGVLTIRTYTSNGYDSLGVGWDDVGMSGYQNMMSNAGWTSVDRDVTTSGVISTYTRDDDGNYVRSLAISSESINTDQTVRFGHALDRTYLGDASGVEAYTVITGESPGEEWASGTIRAQNDDTYAYTSVLTTGGGFVLNTLAGAGNTDDYDGVGILVNSATADDIGIFRMGAGTDSVFIDVMMEDDDGGITVWSESNEVTVAMTAWFDGDFEAHGYVYAIDLP